MTTTWINLTDLKNWHRDHPTGVQRTLYEILKECVDDENIKFFFFQNSPEPAFVELNYDQVQRILSWKKEAPVDEGEQSPVEIQLNTVDELPRPPSKLFKLVSAIIPEKYLARIPRPFIRLASKIIRTPLHVIRVLKKKKSLDSIPPEPEPIQLPTIKLTEEKTVSLFNEGDTVCLYGGCWGIPNLMESVAKQKSEKNLKVITLMYDLIPVLHPHFFDLVWQKLFINYVFQAITVSDKIIAISNNTKKDIEAECKKAEVKSPPIIVVRLGDDVQPKESSVQSTNLTFTNPYILCVGTIEIRKNHILIYQAYKYLIEKYGATDKIPDMVIVGGKGWLTEDICYQINNDPQARNKIHLITNCSDADLLSLYKGCLFTVYPSVYEGWGLPIAESLKYGKFCLSSQTSSMPEVAGDLIEYFSPFDSSQVAELIWEYSNNPEMLQAREEKILSNFKITEWKNSARFILEESSY